MFFSDKNPQQLAGFALLSQLPAPQQVCLCRILDGTVTAYSLDFAEPLNDHRMPFGLGERGA